MNIAVLARKPLEGTVAENVLKHGVGGINVDACRIPTNSELDDPRLVGKGSFMFNSRNTDYGLGGKELYSHPDGRWPANTLLSPDPEILRGFPHTTSGKVKEDKGGYKSEGNTVFLQGRSTSQNQHGDSGSAARFFSQFEYTEEDIMFFDDEETPVENPKEIKLNGYLYAGDNLEYLRTLPDNSVDSVVTDPPYGLGKEPDPRKVLAAWLNDEVYQPGGKGFMGKEWDSFVPSPVLWQECLRVLKPGGHMIAFAGTRTYDWIVLGVRLAGFEIRDTISWLYGSGFPKSLNISKACNKRAGAERKVVGKVKRWGANASGGRGNQKSNGYQPSVIGAEKFDDITAPATPEAQQWEGWGTALKPSCEPAVLARKPLEGTVAENVLQHGTGGLNIDECRIPTEEPLSGGTYAKGERENRGAMDTWSNEDRAGGKGSGFRNKIGEFQQSEGRWPANTVTDGSESVVSEFPDVKGESWVNTNGARVFNNEGKPTKPTYKGTDNSVGSAARFFTQAPFEETDATLFKYCSKASTSERNEGTEALQAVMEGKGNIHSTVKPVTLIEWMVKLVTPPGGTVLDPFIGSGTTGVAAELAGFRWIGCERETDYAMIAYHRIAYVVENREAILAKREKPAKPAKVKSTAPVEIPVESDDDNDDNGGHGDDGIFF
jgi:DNA modification methylase